MTTRVMNGNSRLELIKMAVILGTTQTIMIDTTISDVASSVAG